MLAKAGKTVVGLDIEPGYLAAVEARGSLPAVERAAVATLPPGVVREGEVGDGEALSSALRELFATHRLPRRVRLGVANQQIVMRTLDLPPLSDPKDLASAVRFQAQEQLPMPIEQAVLEHRSLGPVETAEGLRTRVLLVAARREMIEALLDVVRRAGLRPEGIDVSAFAMIRALHRPGDEGTTLYVSVGGVTNIAIAVGTRCAFTRVVPYGSEALAAELAERRGLTLAHAHGWLEHTGLRAQLEELDGDPAILAEARAVLVDGARRLADELRNSLDFHRMQDGSSALDRAVLTGPAVAIPGFAERLGEALGLEFEPGAIVEARPGALDGLERHRLTVAAGLTVTEVPA